MKSWRILIAEDDDEMRAWLRLALRQLQPAVTEVGTGHDLLDALAHGGPYDAIITDVRMPGLDGLRVAAMARTAGMPTPILVITAFPESAVLRSVSKMPNATLLAKPFEAGELRAALLDLMTR
jgi:CheY-like chemotaxis protein